MGARDPLPLGRFSERGSFTGKMPLAWPRTSLDQLERLHHVPPLRLSLLSNRIVKFTIPCRGFFGNSSSFPILLFQSQSFILSRNESTPVRYPRYITPTESQ